MRKLLFLGGFRDLRGHESFKNTLKPIWTSFSVKIDFRPRITFSLMYCGQKHCEIHAKCQNSADFKMDRLMGILLLRRCFWRIRRLLTWKKKCLLGLCSVLPQTREILDLFSKNLENLDFGSFWAQKCTFSRFSVTKIQKSRDWGQTARNPKRHFFLGSKGVEWA